MELREALSQITEIREQMARTETFRGYRSGTVAFSGLLGIAGAVAQAVSISEPVANIRWYLALWTGVAAICGTVWGAEMVLRCRRTTLSLTKQMTLLAVEQFLPCVAAGGVLTWVIVTYAEGMAEDMKDPADILWVLPGLWAVIFSLGVFASCRLLPRPMFWVGAYYLASGVAALVLAQGDTVLSPWAMVGTFGVGQLLAAVVLYLTLERTDAET